MISSAYQAGELAMAVDALLSFLPVYPGGANRNPPPHKGNKVGLPGTWGAVL